MGKHPLSQAQSNDWPISENCFVPGRVAYTFHYLCPANVHKQSQRLLSSVSPHQTSSTNALRIPIFLQRASVYRIFSIRAEQLFSSMLMQVASRLKRIIMNVKDGRRASTSPSGSSATVDEDGMTEKAVERSAGTQTVSDRSPATNNAGGRKRFRDSSSSNLVRRISCSKVSHPR